MIATNHRLVILSGGNTQDEFDYKYIAHMNLESKNNRRLLGLLFLILGLFYTAAIQLVVSADDLGLSGGASTFIPIILIAIGIWLFLMKEHTLFIHLSGVAQSFEYKLPGSVHDEAQKMISIISEQRRRL